MGRDAYFYDIAGFSDPPIIRIGLHRTRKNGQRAFAAFAAIGNHWRSRLPGGIRSMNLAEWLVRAATLNPSSAALCVGERVEADYRAFAVHAPAIGASL
jgi:hypothetical protein